MSRFRPPSLSGSTAFAIGVTSPTSTANSPNETEILYAGPPTPSFARRQSLSGSPSAPGSSPASPAPSIMTPTAAASVSLSPSSSPTAAASPASAASTPKAAPKRAPPPRPSQVVGNGVAPPTPTNAAPTPLKTEVMSMAELAAFANPALLTNNHISTPTKASTPQASGTALRCDSDATHVAKVHCPDCDENYCHDCDSIVHSRKKFIAHLRTAIETPDTNAHHTSTPIAQNAASPLSPAAATPTAMSVDSPAGAGEVLYRGPATPSFARKKSIIDARGAGPNNQGIAPTPAISSPSPSPSAASASASPSVLSSSSPPPAASSALPAGWCEYQDKTSGKSYYHHAASKVTVWERPAAPSSSVVSTDAGAAAAAAAQRQRELDQRMRREHEERIAKAKAEAEAEAAAAEEARRVEAAEVERRRVEAELQQREAERVAAEKAEREAAEAKAAAIAQAQAEAAAAAAAAAARESALSLERARAAALEEERKRLESQLEQERLERERIAREAEAALRADAEATRLRLESEAADRLRAQAESDRLKRESEAAEAERVRLELAQEAERLRIERARIEQLKLDQAQADAERARQEAARAEQEKQALEARLIAMEKRMEQEASERAARDALAAQQAIIAEQARIAAEEQRRREQQEADQARAKQEQEAIAAAAAAAAVAAIAAEEERRRKQAEADAEAAAEVERRRVEAELQRREAERIATEKAEREAADAKAAAAAAQAQADAAAAAAAESARQKAAALAALSAAASPAALASEWCEYTDKASGRPYYYNKATKVTVWQKPQSMAKQQQEDEQEKEQEKVEAAVTDSNVIVADSGPSVDSAPHAPPLSGVVLQPKRGSVIIRSAPVMDQLESNASSVVTATPLSDSARPVLKANVKRGSVILPSGGEFRPPPPKRGSISMIAPNFPNAKGPGPARGSLIKQNTSAHATSPTLPPAAAPAVSVPTAPDATALKSLAPKRGSVIIQSLPSQVSLSDAMMGADDDDTPSEPPPKPSPAAIAARRVSMSLGLVHNGALINKQNDNPATAAPAKVAPATPAQSPVPSNPDEWRAVQTPSGQTYWYNRRSRETSWVDPALAQSTPDQPSNSHRLNPDWRQYADQTGKPYYHNKKTSETLWEVPTDFYLPEDEDEKEKEKEKEKVSPPAPTSAATKHTRANSSDSTGLDNRARPLSIASSVDSDDDFDRDDLSSDDDAPTVDDDDDDDVSELAALSLSGGGVGAVASDTAATASGGSGPTDNYNARGGGGSGSGDQQQKQLHARTVSDASPAPMTPTSTSRATSASMAVSPSGATPKSQIRKCALPECVSFSVRAGYCLRHQWRVGFDTSNGRTKEVMGQYVAAKEILTTEKSYLEQLRTIHKAFYTRLAESITLCATMHRPTIINEQDLNILFINHAELLAISESMYADLADLHFHDRLVEFVACVILHYIPRFTVYSEYLEGFDESRKRLLKLKESNPEFAQFITVTEKIEGLNLESFLVTPVQRLPRYLLLLKELSRRLTATDRVTLQVLADCTSAHDDLAKMTTSLNSALNTAENLSQLKNLSRLFLRTDSRFQAFLKPNRKLIKQGILRKKFSSKSYNLQSYKTYYFFLTNDLIWYASAIRDQSDLADAVTGQSHIAMNAALNNATNDATTEPLYKMKHLYRLEDMYVDKHDPKITAKSAKKAPNPLKFYMWNEDGRVIGIQAASEIEREQWYNAVDAAIAAVKKQTR